MKNQIGRWIGKSLIVVAVAASTVIAEAQVTISDGSSYATISPNTSAGMDSWWVGGANVLNKQWFYYRIGGVGAQSPINTISLASVNYVGPSIVELSYANSQISVQINYWLTHYSPGNADIQEEIFVSNLSGSTISGFNFFQYSDFDLSVNNDQLTILPAGPGVYDKASQTSGLTELSETVVSPPAAGSRADDAFSLLNLIENTPSVNLTGPLAYYGDAAWAFQWTFNLSPGQTVTVIKDKLVAVTPIPEPSALAVFALGLAGLCLRRSR